MTAQLLRSAILKPLEAATTASPPWPQIAALARLAPSPHTTQPWRLRAASGVEAELLYEPSRLLPQTDPDGRFMTLTMGIFAEALDIAARPHGFTLDCEFSGTRFDFAAKGPQPFAHLVAHSAEGSDPAPGHQL